ncbi:basic proline-rich protein-like [Iris pallida]|uniref:Basic proline-rich protein-like n=1 Tax=Iris pallida TaxID=29817 RepID=A0AAX6G2U2_IRIPA|nr:basic proline-rich protein-like [Iris pallida]
MTSAITKDDPTNAGNSYNHKIVSGPVHPCQILLHHITIYKQSCVRQTRTRYSRLSPANQLHTADTFRPNPTSSPIRPGERRYATEFS